MRNPSVAVQGTLDKTQAGGVHERQLLAQDVLADPGFYNSFTVTTSDTGQISHTKGGVLIGQGLGWEGSTNWSASGEGTGIKLASAAQATGYKAQNNTLLVSANSVFLTRFGARLDTEHKHAIHSRTAKGLPLT